MEGEPFGGRRWVVSVHVFHEESGEVGLRVPYDAVLGATRHLCIQPNERDYNARRLDRPV